MKKWRLRVGNGFTSGHIVIWLMRQDIDHSLSFSPNTQPVHSSTFSEHVLGNKMNPMQCPQGVRELNQILYCNWWNYEGEHRGCQSAEEKRGAPGEAPGEDMNDHWLATKGAGRAPGKRAAWTHPWTQQRAWATYQMRESHHVAKTKVRCSG